MSSGLTIQEGPQPTAQQLAAGDAVEHTRTVNCEWGGGPDSRGFRALPHPKLPDPCVQVPWVTYPFPSCFHLAAVSARPSVLLHRAGCSLCSLKRLPRHSLAS